jgi:hypothetical protein
VTAPVAGFPARPPVRPLVAAAAPNPNPDLEETTEAMTEPSPREYRVDPGSATRLALHVMDDLWVDCTRDRALTAQDVEGWTRLAPVAPVSLLADLERGDRG